MARPVKINPSAMVDDDLDPASRTTSPITTPDAVPHASSLLWRPPLSASMCLEDVVRYYGDEERQRKIGTEPKDSDRKHIRSAINELVSSIKVLCPRLSKELHVNLSQATMTKLMARHSTCLYKEILKVDSLVDAYWVVFSESKHGHTSIRKQMEQISFKPLSVPEAVDVHWEIPNFTSIEYTNWQEPLSTEAYTALVYGMAWSISTLQHRDWDEFNIRNYFLPEIRHLEKSIAYRRVDLLSFKSKIEIDKGFISSSESPDES